MNTQLGGDLPAAITEVESNIAEQGRHQVEREGMAEVVATMQEKRASGFSSLSDSDGDPNLTKLDSRIVKIRDQPVEDAAFAHLPEHEQAILKKQVDVRAVAVDFKTLYRYATKTDMAIVATSVVCAIAGGAALPLMTVCHETINHTGKIADDKQRSYLAISLALSKV